MGSCSLGAALGTPEDICDIFCRVEGVPRSTMLPLLKRIKDWNTFPEYLSHLEKLPLGPNVGVFAGHSNIRMEVLGFERSLDPKLGPSAAELAKMVALLEEALDAGYLGLSSRHCHGTNSMATASKPASALLLCALERISQADAGIEEARENFSGRSQHHDQSQCSPVSPREHRALSPPVEDDGDLINGRGRK